MEEPGAPTFAWTLASLATAVFVALAVLSVLLLVAEWQLMRPAVYRRAFEDTHFYQRFPQLLGRQLYAEGGPHLEGVNRGAFFGNLSEEQYQVMVTALMPPEWVERQANGLVDQVFAFMNSNQPALSLVVDTSELKARATGAEGEAVVRLVVDSWPSCGLEQMSAWLQSDLSQPPVCKPPEELLPAAVGLTHRVLSAPFALTPGQIDLAGGLNSVELASGGRVSPGRVLVTLRGLRRWAWLFPVAALFFLMLGVLFGSRTARQGARWVGVSLLLAGAGTLLAVLLLLLLLGAFSGSIAGSFAGSLVAPAVVLMGEVLRAVGFRYLLVSALVAGFLLALGAGLWVLARSVKA
jgi:hypothetical protein